MIQDEKAVVKVSRGGSRIWLNYGSNDARIVAARAITDIDIKRRGLGKLLRHFPSGGVGVNRVSICGEAAGGDRP